MSEKKTEPVPQIRLNREPLLFKDFEEIRRKFIRQIHESERLTGDERATRINATDDGPLTAEPKRR